MPKYEELKAFRKQNLIPEYNDSSSEKTMLHREARALAISRLEESHEPRKNSQMLYRGGINLMTTGNAESGTMKSDALKYRLNGTPLIISCPVMPTMIWCCGSRYLPAILLIISLMSRITSMSLYAVRIYA